MNDIKIPCGYLKGTLVSQLTRKQLLGSIDFFRKFKFGLYKHVFLAMEERLANPDKRLAREKKNNGWGYKDPDKLSRKGKKYRYLHSSKGQARTGMLRRMARKRS